MGDVFSNIKYLKTERVHRFTRVLRESERPQRSLSPHGIPRGLCLTRASPDVSCLTRASPEVSVSPERPQRSLVSPERPQRSLVSPERLQRSLVSPERPQRSLSHQSVPRGLCLTRASSEVSVLPERPLRSLNMIKVSPERHQRL